MCGIAGIVALDPERHPEASAIDRMVETLHHRGPDDTGVVTLPGVALGLKRLSIIDVAGGRQPIHNEDETITFVGNGEIFNFRALREELESKGHRFRTGSDMEVIVHGYEVWGDAVTEHINGQFAFALWDAKRRRLLAARDRAGEKPLYYYDGGGDIVFASELKSLLSRADIPRELDPVALDGFLTYEFIMAPRTIFRGVKKLPPAHAMAVEGGRVRTWSYWEPPSEVDVHRSESDWIEELRETLDRAVRSQMMSDVPFGAFLSGGVDSSTIVALMAGASERPIKTFSIAFSEGSYDESGYAREIANLFGTEHREEKLDPSVADLFDRLVVHLDEPFADVSLFPTYMVSQFAAQDVKVVLSGDGGDELFGGYDWYVADRLSRQLARFPGKTALSILDALFERVPPSEKKKGLVNKAKRFLEGMREAPELEHYRFLWHLPEAQKKGLYTQRMRDATAADDPKDPVVAMLSAHGGSDVLNRQLYADFKLFLSDDILVKVDRMSMAASLEARAPFLDRDVIELAFRMPGHLKLRGNTRKYILKKSMEDILPDHILNRRKEGFSIPLKNWLRRDLRGRMGELLSEERIAARGLFEPREVKRMREAHLAGRANHAHQLFPLMVFERWAEAFLR